MPEVRRIRWLRRAVGSALDGLESIWSIDARRSRSGSWLAAPEDLCGRILTEEPSTDNEGWPIPQCREGFSGPPGVYCLNGARVYSVLSGSPDPKDPLARHVRVLSAHFRPIRNGSAAGMWRWLRQPEILDQLHSRQTIERAVLLGGYAEDCNNYFHFWIDVLCDLWFLKRSGVSMDAGTKYLMPLGSYPWQEEILRMCGIPLERVVPFSSFGALRASQLFMPFRARGGRINPDWLVDALHDLSGYRRPGQAGWRNIYITRQNAPRRPVLNETELITHLRSHGFEVHDCAQMTVAEQQTLFAQAAVIIAPHGAALTNLIWCPGNTRVIEFYPLAHANPCFHDLASMLGLTYQAIPCPQDKHDVNPLTAPYRVEGFAWPMPGPSRQDSSRTV